jgi:hypothetical protein
MQTACWSSCFAGGILEHIANPEILVGATFSGPHNLQHLKVNQLHSLRGMDCGSAVW